MSQATTDLAAAAQRYREHLAVMDSHRPLSVSPYGKRMQDRIATSSGFWWTINESLLRSDTALLARAYVERDDETNNLLSPKENSCTK